jgi:hypothetical protein
MNCVELRDSLIEIEDASSAEQRAHLRTCPDCSALVEDLNSIAATAIELRGADEPSPRVWKSVETALRREGLIRPQHAGHSLLPFLAHPAAAVRWMIPAAAVLLLAIGIYLRPHSTPRQLPLDNSASSPRFDSDVQLAGLNDDDLLQEIGQQTPALQAQYTENLQRVNQYIQDARSVVAADPNDEEARRSLMEAYQQKAMLFQLALDRSLP